MKKLCLLFCFLVFLFSCTKDTVVSEVSSPTTVMDYLSTIKNGMSIGTNHSMILRDDGSLWMAGSNDSGQLANGINEGLSEYPRAIKIMDGVTSVSAGTYCSAILKNDGTLWVSGINSYGQLGIDSTDNSEKILNFKKIMDNVASVSTNNFRMLVIKNDGTLWSCGNNIYGALGINSEEREILKPVKVTDNVAMAMSGDHFTAILKKDGTLWLSGMYYSHGGDEGWVSDSLVPFKIQEQVKYISCEGTHIFYIKNDDSLWGMGQGSYSSIGEMGNPVKITENVKKVVSSEDFALMLKTDNSLYAYGDGTCGQFGIGESAAASAYPSAEIYKIMENVKDVTVGYRNTIIKKNDGTFWATGENSFGELAVGKQSELGHGECIYNFTQISF